MASLLEIIDRINKRKEAAGNDSEYGRVVKDDQAVLAPFSDLDLPLDDLVRMKREVTISAAYGIKEGASLSELAFGLWFDAFATGVMFEQERQKEEA